MSLATDFRPHTFEECLGQKTTIQILKAQIEKSSFSNAYLFTGPSGCGKTTLCKIFASEINKGKGSPIEVDGASNNGVDNVRALIEEAQQRSLDSEYKVIIVDECHMITTAGWNAFLKCIEECPKYTIFLFCTTDPQRVPATIKNRCMIFNLARVSAEEIKNRLELICKQRNYNVDSGSLDFIAKLGNGGVRDAIAYLEKVVAYSSSATLDTTLECLGTFSYETFFKLTDAIIDGNEGEVFSILEELLFKGKDLKQFVEHYLEFVLDLDKYCLFQDLGMLKVPSTLEQRVKYSTGIENNTKYYAWLINKVLDIKNTIRYDSFAANTVKAMFLAITRGC